MSAVRFAPNAFSNCRCACAHPFIPPQTGFACLGHPQLLAPAITATLFDGDQAVALQRQDVPAERGAVHHHLRGERIDRHRAQSPQLRKN